ncbi:MAG: hypothetical protein EOM76_11570, partial [Sphingobacteriia bacterium]|nr:hypothetical protein [Sphingobacteriia bacterium]
MKSNLFQRVLSALILGPVVLWAILYGDRDVIPAYTLLLAIMGAVMAWEWEKMVTGKTSEIAVILATSTTMLAFLRLDNPLFSLFLIAVTALLVYFKSGKKLLLSFGAFYICLPLLSLIYLGYKDPVYSYEIILWLLCVIWATDIGGYVFGKSIGGPKLAPKSSPKKTWAGLFGGIISASFVTYEFVGFMNTHYESQMSVTLFVGASAVLAVIAQIGDIFETASGGTPLSTESQFYKDGKIPWINSGEVRSGLIISTENHITELGLKNSSAKIFPKNTVLVAMYGATAGQVGILGIEASTNQAVCGIFPNEKVYSVYLFNFLSTQLDQLLGLRSGIARLNLSQEKIRNFRIPVPPLNIQQQIVAECEAVDKAVEQAQTDIQNAQQAIADAFTAAAQAAH